MLELTQRIQSLGERERLVLGWGIVCALLIIIYTILWQPWQEELDRLRVQIPVKQETLAWMRAQASLVGPLLQQVENKKQSQNKPLLTVIERSAQHSNINNNIRRMTPDEDGRVNIWLTDVDFDKWVTWLETLRSIGIEVNTASVNRGKGNAVTVRVTVQR